METERLAYPLTADSLVWDVGAYRGEFAFEIVKLYKCRVVCFEPMPVYVDHVRKRLHTITDRAVVNDFGLMDRDCQADVPLDGDRTSLYHEHAIKADYSGGPMFPCRFRDVAAYMEEQDAPHVSLAKINIEGGEYPLLNRLIETGYIAHFGHLQVQFHDFMPDAASLYHDLTVSLSRTHRQQWCRPWIWESWERR